MGSNFSAWGMYYAFVSIHAHANLPAFRHEKHCGGAIVLYLLHRFPRVRVTTCNHVCRIQSFNEYIAKKVEGTNITFVDVHAPSLAFRYARTAKIVTFACAAQTSTLAETQR
jgi:hypothetical protein